MVDEPLDDPLNHPLEDQHKGQPTRMLLQDLINVRSQYLDILKRAEHSTFGFFVRKNSDYTEEECLADGFTIEQYNELRVIEKEIDKRYGELLTGYNEWVKRLERADEIKACLSSSKEHLEMMEGLFDEMSERWFTLNKQGFKNARDAASKLNQELGVLFDAYVLKGDIKELETKVNQLIDASMHTIDKNHDDSFEMIREEAKFKDAFFAWFAKLLVHLKAADVSEPAPSLSVDEYDSIERSLHKTTGSESKQFQASVKKFFDEKRDTQHGAKPEEPEPDITI